MNFTDPRIKFTNLPGGLAVSTIRVGSEEVYETVLLPVTGAVEKERRFSRPKNAYPKASALAYHAGLVREHGSPKDER